MLLLIGSTVPSVSGVISSETFVALDLDRVVLFFGASRAGADFAAVLARLGGILART